MNQGRTLVAVKGTLIWLRMGMNQGHTLVTVKGTLI